MPLPAGYTVDEPMADAASDQKPESTGSRILAGAEDFGKGVLKGGLNTVNGLSSLIHKIPGGIGEALVPSSGLRADELYAKPTNTMQSVGEGVEQGAEFLLPGLGEEAAGAKLATLAPKLGRAAAPLARVATQAIGSGLINKAQGGEFGTGAATGAAGGAIGEGMRAAAPALAETALRVRGNDRLYGRTVGDAILKDTTGVRPGTIAEQAQEKISELTPQVQALAENAGQGGARGSLGPARQGLAKSIQNHTLNRATDSIEELSPLSARLAVDSVTGLPLAESQSPVGLLNLKRGLNSDFIQNWKPDQPPGLRSSAKTAYRALADEFHQAAPGTQELDQRISSLIPVTKRAQAAENNAGLLQRSAGRIAAHTGALAAGTIAGEREGGLPGAIVGGGLGILAPEMLSSPTVQMIGARGLNGIIPRLLPLIQGEALQHGDRK